MLLQRVATSLVGAPLILGLIIWGGPPYSVAVAAVLTFAALEFFAATDPNPPGVQPPGSSLRRLVAQRPPALLAAAAVALLVAAAHNGTDWWTGALVLIVALTFLGLTLQADVPTALPSWLWLTGGIIYVGFLGSHLALLRHLHDWRDWAILAVFATFATDTTAYFVGRALGRTHVAAAISPGKTLEGFLGGFAGGFAAVLLLNWILNALTDLPFEAPEIVFLALLLPLAAFIGDLAESLLKRGAGVKDASRVIPGHGGLLDRLDSLLFTVPLVYYYLTWVIL